MTGFRHQGQEAAEDGERDGWDLSDGDMFPEDPTIDYAEPAPYTSDDSGRCGAFGDGLHEYGRCKKRVGHDMGMSEDDEPLIHEDEEGYRWW